MKSRWCTVLVACLLCILGLASCDTDLRDGETQPLRVPTSTPLSHSDTLSSSNAAAATSTPLPHPTQTPSPPPTDSSTAGIPEHVRLDLEDGIVVAFAEDPSLGRVAYVTHVPSGAQAVLDANGNLVRESLSNNAGSTLSGVLSDRSATERIKKGLSFDGPLPRNPIADWINLIRFNGITYSFKTNHSLDQSHLGDILYRVAFNLDANLIPAAYQVQDGDATYLALGTTVHSVDGYDPSQGLAAFVNGDVLLFERAP